jgi:hypothetical protein
MTASPRVVVFAGPSLPPAFRPCDRSAGYASEGRAVLSPGIDWRPPVKQGEVYEAALSRPAIIGIIDGYFEVTPTVWHKEILWAMAQGIHVYGSASIGALRAAELDSFGMVGIGRIYEAFRDGVLEDDDEVAVLHGPEELGYPAVTEAMVNIRATLGKAVAEGVLDQALGDRIIEIAKSLFYKDRTWDAILSIAARELSLIARGLQVWVRTGIVDQKRADAMALVSAISRHLAAGPSPLTVSYRFHATGYHRAAANGSV